MPVPPIPPPMDRVGARPFSFYPPILNIEHNEWLFRRATWSEILVFNTKSDAELWVPRRFLGEVSSVDEPVMIVGLKKELEFKAGALWPHERRVIEMPRAVNDSPRGAPPAEEAKLAAVVVGIRLESAAESRIGRLMLAIIALGIFLCVVVVAFFRGGPVGTRVEYAPVLQSDLPFTARDDYYSIVNRLGQPAEARWRSDKGELQFEKLWYPQQAMSVILMGSERKTARYVGAMDKNWRVIHSVQLPGGQNSATMLRSLARF